MDMLPLYDRAMIYLFSYDTIDVCPSIVLPIDPPSIFVFNVPICKCGIQQLLLLASSYLCSCCFISEYHKNTNLSMPDDNKYV